MQFIIPTLFLKKRRGFCYRLCRPKGGAIYYSHAFLKKAEGILLSPLSVCLSVRPLCYLLLNHWTIFNQIWCVSYSREWGVQRQTFLAPPPGALGRGQKFKYHLISITKSISKIFIPNFVVFSQIKDTKHIRRDFHSVAWVMPQGWDFGVLAVPRWSKIYFQILKLQKDILETSDNDKIESIKKNTGKK